MDCSPQEGVSYIVWKNLRKMGVMRRMKPVKMSVLLIVVLLAMMVIVPMVSAGEKNIIINITSPEEGEVYFVSDAIPSYITTSVLGVIDAAYGIQNITITNWIRETECGFTSGNHSGISCEVQSDVGKNQVIITARDKQGNSARIVRNYSFELQQLAPPQNNEYFHLRKSYRYWRTCDFGC